MENDNYCYFTQTLSQILSPLPIEICDVIIDFCNIPLPIKTNKTNTPIGLSFISLHHKRCKDINGAYELDTCNCCYNWKFQCKK